MFTRQTKVKQVSSCFRIALSGAMVFNHIMGASFALWGLLTLSASALAPSSARADIARLISFQGRLTDKNKNPRTGPFDMTFKIFDAPAGGAELWSESYSGGSQVAVSNGIFSVRLGSLTPLPDYVFNDENAYLEVIVSGETPSARQRLVAASYAFNSGRLMGSAAGFFVSTSPVSQTIGGGQDLYRQRGRWNGESLLEV
jgi:hypothetical protein